MEGSKTSKRKLSETETSEAEARKECPYGSKCYRLNPDHLREFYHPGERVNMSEETQAKKANVIQSLPKYGFYLTKIHDVKNSSKINGSYSLGIKDILSLDKESFVESAQFNYMHDIEWLVDKYPKENQDKPLTIVNGNPFGEEYKQFSEVYPQLKFIRARLEAYGTHHTKMMLLVYKTGMRVVIHTANLIEQDWHQKTQGIWMSDLFPRIPQGSNPNAKNFDSKTSFKQYLATYLEYYNEKKLNYWIDLIKQHDMSSANVFIVGSTPGRLPSTKKIFGHLRLRKLLSDHVQSNQQDHIVCQFSSIGSLGATESNWLCKEFLTSLSSTKQTELKVQKTLKPMLIFPSVDNVRTSYEGYSAGQSLPYSKSVASKQQWLNNYLYQWKADRVDRTRASPHIKTFARYSHDFKQLYWFLLTSSNLSKAAWGSFEKNESQLFIRSYEIGVLFIPAFLQDDETKTLIELDDSNNNFLIPYDLPPVKYGSNDKPWIVDVSYTDKEDSHGRTWKINYS